MHSPAERDRVDDRKDPQASPPERLEPHDQQARPAAGEALAKGGLVPANAPEARRHPIREDYGRGSEEGSRTAIREAGQGAGGGERSGSDEPGRGRRGD